MLTDKVMFDALEETLTKGGRLAKFEAQFGAIRGRMMITRTTIPDEMDVRFVPRKKPQAFEASFDFYDAAVGLAIYTDTREAATGIWITPQKENAEPPAQEWIEFFVEKLMDSIEEDGSYGVPIYSFLSDTGDMTIVPAKAETA